MAVYYKKYTCSYERSFFLFYVKVAFNILPNDNNVTKNLLVVKLWMQFTLLQENRELVNQLKADIFLVL
ncbi:hypothetical protein, partial [Cylindrospermopsis raciborskii]|uniref:hypothetical protein n=1 Tax=Cylindrospermopsis raciborskii TaxID=77022 RepID=UPI0026EBF078